MTTQDTRKTIYIVYAGMIEDKKHIYYEVIKEEDKWILTDKRFFFDKSLFTRKVIGWIYEVTEDWDSVFYKKSSLQHHYLSWYRDILLKWVALDWVFVAKSKEASIPKEIYQKTLDPLREVYKNTPAVARPILIANIVSYLTK